MPQLDAGQRPVTVYRFGHERMSADVVIVPHRGKGERRVVRSGIDRASARADHPPTTFCFGLPESGANARKRIGHAAGVRHLVEAVGSGDGPDFHGLEQDLIAGILRHGLPRLRAPSTMGAAEWCDATAGGFIAK